MNRQQTFSRDDLDRLLAQVRETMRFKHYSPRTEEVYLDWIQHYLRFHGHRHPAALGTADIEAFLTHLAAKRHVTATTQRQAFCALIWQGRSSPYASSDGFRPGGTVENSPPFQRWGDMQARHPESPGGTTDGDRQSSVVPPGLRAY